MRKDNGRLAAAQHALEEMFRAAEARGTVVSALWQQLDGTEPLYARQPQRQVVSASVIKVPILVAALARVQTGGLALDAPVPVEAEDILDDTQVFDTGPRTAVLEELLTWMTVLSDNTATNVLIRLLGMDFVNETCAALGLGQTSLQRRMLDFAAVRAGRNNYTSAGDMLRLFGALCGESILTPALCRKAVHILQKQRNRDYFTRYIWEDVTAAHKTGMLDNLTHDAGVFTVGGRQYFLGVFLQNTPAPEGDPALLGRAARTAFDYYRSLEEEKG